MNKLIQYLKETRNELKEVVFPTTTQTINFTLLVIVISVIVATLLFSADKGLSTILAKIVNTSSGSAVTAPSVIGTSTPTKKTSSSTPSKPSSLPAPATSPITIPN